jgi:hypothetical protein
VTGWARAAADAVGMRKLQSNHLDKELAGDPVDVSSCFWLLADKRDLSL